ncbi:GyrI-like domain-containing protein [Engelhardtia mirabilis]|uniref:Bacterial transcription activator, effector binding domain n=1 Tax=Engelhardtia mirabilis TaxID=2528011 RepID=A0A518BKP0_9BACT|nr:Bacterial transcription activator, effector binding domain [Planctomycetes bacterium Pla133]QDV01870.1 Bacterial transcription activator, effector binding domain [Planctomycetes bacterium Pla86]
MKLRTSISALICAALLGGCSLLGTSSTLNMQTSNAMRSAPVGVAVEVDWKERLDQPYVFLELLGDYSETRRYLETLAKHAYSQGVAPSGPPFALFYDDPARVAPIDRRSRICLPVTGPIQVAGPLGYDILPSEPVVYGFVRGAYRDLENAYGGVFEYMGARSWVLTGPIREIYLTDPGTVRGPEELLAELQMPWRPL